MQNVRAELVESLDEAEWNWLQPHAERDFVIIVSLDLSLVDVGEAIATDNTQRVQRWIEEALIQKPSPAQIADWNQNRDKRFNALIVQPYVLAQEI